MALSRQSAVVLVGLCACGRTELLTATTPDVATPRFEGLIVVTQHLEGFLPNDPPPRPVVFAAFSSGALRREGDRAEFDDFGCQLVGARSLDAGAPMSAGEGTFRSDGGADSFSLISSGSSPGVYYRELTVPTLPQAMEVSFSGAEVPGFSVPVATVDQTAVTIEGVACPRHTCGPFQRFRDLSVTWDAGRGDAVVRIETVTRGLFCRFPASMGRATLLESDLRQLEGDTVIEAGSFTAAELRRGPTRLIVRTYRQSLEGHLHLP